MHALLFTDEYILQHYRMPDTSAGEYPMHTPDWYDFTEVSVANPLAKETLQHWRTTCANEPNTWRIIRRSVNETLVP